VNEVSRQSFLEYLHDALNHLYNADLLRKSPLASILSVSSRFETSAGLRKVLVEAIDSLKPDDSEPESSKAWRTYESLYCCFIQQLNQQVVADQLSISARQLRREQHNALEHLADLLWEKYHLAEALPPSRPEPEQETQDDKPAHSRLISEMDWILDSQPAAPTRLADEVQTAVGVFQGMAQKSCLSVQSQIPADLPALAIHPTALNQILVSLLSIAFSSSAENCEIRLSANRLPMAVELTLDLSAVPAQERSEQEKQEQENSLSIADELVRVSGGHLAHEPAEKGFFPMRLVLPALEQFPVLVIDDNEDSLQLVKRYAAGTRYRLICTRDTDQVLELAASFHPRIIVLDIMMPKENGWIVLGRLRQHPLTAETAIIVSTILPQEKLALSLGASAYLKKPVSRQEFLQALDQQFSLLGPEFQ
jgi:CheY-like chemotaxis protein